MATIELNTSEVLSTTHISAHAHAYKSVYVPVTVDFAVAAARKGSALAAGDIIRVIRLPAGTIVKSATIKKASATDATTLTVDVGVSNVDADRFVDGFDVQAAAVGDYGVDTLTPTRIIVGTTPDWFDITLATLTGTLTSGKVIVGAELLDISDPAASAGLANRK